MSVLAERDCTLSSQKWELFAHLLKEKNIDTPQSQAFSRRMSASPCQPSFAQQRLWLLDKFEPGGHLYNIPVVVRLMDRLNVPALKQSLNEIMRRHEGLRATVATVEGVPMQVFAAAGGPLQVTNLTGLSRAEREAEAQRLSSEEVRRPFDLACGPLFRASLLRLGDSDHVLLLTMHHIVSDGWSLGVLMREFTMLYDAFSRGEASCLSELPIQYADYAIWQRKWLREEVLEKQLSYWRDQLMGAPAVLELPTDRPRPPGQSFRGASCSRVLRKDLLKSLKALSEHEGVTLFMTLLAVFTSLLSRYVAREDIVIGTPIAGRNRTEIEGLIGLFVNTLVLRSDLSGNPTFRELLGRVRETTLGAYEHQDLPFEKLVEELHPERDPSRNPLFQIMFALHKATQTRSKPHGLKMNQLALSGETSKFDLTLFVIEEAEELRAVVEFSTDLFDSSSILRMLSHYETLLEEAVGQADRRLSELSLLTAEERHQLVVEWNQTGAEYAGVKTAHRLFEEQTLRTPDAVAVISETGQLTYEELNQRANQVAQYLHGLGVHPEVRVGICMGRSLEMVIVLLGILKAGGTYVPLDPTYPRERLAFMMDNADIHLLVTEQELLNFLPEVKGQILFFGEAQQEDIAAQSKKNPVNLVHPESLAYIIYTSGSTGQPKGVMVHHRGLVNYLLWATETYQVRLGQGAPVHSSLSFDLTITSLFTPLLAGQAVVLLAEEPGVEALSSALEGGQNFSLVKLTPSHLKLLEQSLSAEAARECARVLVIGGEALLGENVRFWLDNGSQIKLINEYGPTETVVGCCTYEVQYGRELGGGVPIGRPIANTALYVLDGQMNPVPIGMPGELYVGGMGVARGYFNLPRMTAEKFVPDPFGTQAGQRLYRTGDRVRYLTDGLLEFLGRNDEQVKVRGYRIELGEIEAVLCQHEDVFEASVVALQDGEAVKRLFAYVVSRSGAKLSSGDLRLWARAKLPDYMVPTQFVMLDALPLTPSGKLDRRALPMPDGARENAAREYVAPRNKIEELLAAQWAEVLVVGRIGVHDDFFEMGGYSLMAARLVHLVHHKLGIKLGMRTIFDEPTVARQALIVEEMMIAELEDLSETEAERLSQDHYERV